jgi:formylglycine-generating enzyme required for sulfatase activity
MAMLPITPGSFLMGDPTSAEARPHRVRLEHSYFLSDCEVTVAQFRRFVEDADPNVEKLAWRGPDKTVSPTQDCPVQRVSWLGAVLFCNWLSRLEGRRECYRREGVAWKCDFCADGYRLPTEAEWEYACRAGSATAFSFGHDEPERLRDFGIYRGNSLSQARPVGSKLPNAWGLFDMHGNVSEWCWDWHGDYGVQELVDPVGPATGDSRVHRGGGWYSLSSRECWSPARDWSKPESSSPRIGFRVLCSGSASSVR